MSCNDRSILLSITCHGRRVLLCGDIEQIAQQELLDREHLKADVLALPHHGAVVNNTAAFIHAVDPVWCVRSTGYRDTQSRRLIDIMSGYGYLSTAEHGTLEIEIGPKDLRLRPWGRGESMDTGPEG
jgi:competence protein ComEC